MTKRKYIRIALTHDDESVFYEAKKEMEALTGVQMSDSMYALSMIRQSLLARAGIKRILNAKPV